jgi:hypothetical protein
LGTDIGTTVTGGYNLHVRFADSGNQPIERVVFALNDGSTVVDAGTFSPRVTIDQTFELMPNNADGCSVGSATFAMEPSGAHARRTLWRQVPVGEYRLRSIHD